MEVPRLIIKEHIIINHVGISNCVTLPCPFTRHIPSKKILMNFCPSCAPCIKAEAAPHLDTPLRRSGQELSYTAWHKAYARIPTGKAELASKATGQLLSLCSFCLFFFCTCQDSNTYRKQIVLNIVDIIKLKKHCRFYF